MDKASFKLERLGVIHTPAVLKFTAKENFTIDTSENAVVKIEHLGHNFKKHLLPLVENDPVLPGKLAVDKLVGRAKDSQILSSLGGEGLACISLSQFYFSFAGKPDKKRVLFSANESIIAYIFVGINLWAVRGRQWIPRGFGFEAFPLDEPPEWGQDSLILSQLY